MGQGAESIPTLIPTEEANAADGRSAGEAVSAGTFPTVDTQTIIFVSLRIDLRSGAPIGYSTQLREQRDKS